jgi:hypothetical protein
MTRDALASLALAGLLLGCDQYFRPDHPLRGSDGPTTVEVQKATFRDSTVEVDLRDARPTAALDGAWLFATASPDGAPCARKGAARTIAPGQRSPDGARYAAHFKSLSDLLDAPATLEVRVSAAGEAPRCLSIPFSGETPDLAWTLEPWHDDRVFAGRGVKFWAPDRYGFAVDWTLLRLGRWWGPARFGAGTGLGFAWGSPQHPGDALVFPFALTAETFPLVWRRSALGLIASYDLRPSYGHQPGFELIHGPSAGVELAGLPVDLPGFIRGPRGGTLSLQFLFGRWLPNGGSNVFSVALMLN